MFFQVGKPIAQRCTRGPLGTPEGFLWVYHREVLDSSSEDQDSGSGTREKSLHLRLQSGQNMS